MGSNPFGNLCCCCCEAAVLQILLLLQAAFHPWLSAGCHGEPGFQEQLEQRHRDGSLRGTCQAVLIRSSGREAHGLAPNAQNQGTRAAGLLCGA